MAENLTPRVDIVFKKIFGVEENKDLLISLINSIVSKEDQVADLTLLNPYNPQSFKYDKLSILDIKAQGVNGKRYNIEMQITDDGDYDKRALYYWAKLYTEQLRKGDAYNTLSKAIGIHILNFTGVVGTKKYHNVFRIFEVEERTEHFPDLELHTIELNKFLPMDAPKDLRDFVPKIKTALDGWSAFLSRRDLIDTQKVTDPHLIKALHVLEVMNFSSAERDSYEDHLKWFMTEAAALKKRYTDGMQEGRAKGHAEGRAEGRAEGERLMAVAIARKMLQSGQDLSVIREVTNLSAAELQGLQKTNG